MSGDRQDSTLVGPTSSGQNTDGDASRLKYLGVCNAEAEQRELPHGVKAEKANG